MQMFALARLFPSLMNFPFMSFSHLPCPPLKWNVLTAFDDLLSVVNHLSVVFSIFFLSFVAHDFYAS